MYGQNDPEIFDESPGTFSWGFFYLLIVCLQLSIYGMSGLREFCVRKAFKERSNLQIPDQCQSNLHPIYYVIVMGTRDLCDTV